MGVSVRPVAVCLLPARERCAARAAQIWAVLTTAILTTAILTMALLTMAILICRRAARASRALPVDQQLAPATKLKGLLATARLLLGAPRPQRRSRYRSRSPQQPQQPQQQPQQLQQLQ